MDNKVWILLVVAVVLTFGFQYYLKRKGKKLSEELINGMMTMNKEEFFEKANSRMARMTIPVYNNTFMKMNYCIMHHETKEMKRLIVFMEERVRMNEKQEMAFLNLAFSFYLDEEDEKNCEKTFKRVKELLSKREDDDAKAVIEEMDLTLNVFIRKDPKAETVLLKRIEESESDEEKAVYLSRLGIYYINVDKKEKAKNCIRQALEKTKDEMIIEQLKQMLEKI